VAALTGRPEQVHVIVRGERASEVVEAADLGDGNEGSETPVHEGYTGAAGKSITEGE